MGWIGCGINRQVLNVSHDLFHFFSIYFLQLKNTYHTKHFCPRIFMTYFWWYRCCVYIVHLSWNSTTQKNILCAMFNVYLYHVLPIVLLSVYGYGTLLWSECLCLECPPMHISYSTMCLDVAMYNSEPKLWILFGNCKGKNVLILKVWESLTLLKTGLWIL